MAERISARKFKAHCLKIMDDVAAQRKKIIVTKHGVPVVQITPVNSRPRSIFGWLKGSVDYNHNFIDSTDEMWDADLPR